MKERLVGAAVLVAVAVIVIPIILGDHNKRGANTRNAPLPAATTSPTREYRMNLSNNSPTTFNRPATPADKPAPPKRRVPTPTRPANNRSASPESLADQAPAEPDASTPGTANPSSNGPASMSPSESQAAPPPSGGWAVQAGSFSKQANARNVVKKLKRKGYKAFISKHQSSGTTYFRVRVGPVPDRAHAEALAPEVGDAAGGQVAVVPNK